MLATPYEQALAFWFGRINYEQRAPKPGDFKLDRMRALLGLLGNPQQQLRIVHVAGSKGKGSSSAMLAAILRRAGYRTGLFTSPHLCRVEERFQIDGEVIAEDAFTHFMNEVRPAVESLDNQRGKGAGPTFFEVATALGFLYFARRQVDVAVLEVGLGGRFDSTNVCNPLVALITSISLDHTQMLGDRLSSIAMEKAGIVKPGRPTISGVTAPAAREVIESICRERQSPLRQLDVDFRFHYEPGQVTAHSERRPRVTITTDRQTWPAMELGLFGEHQAANAAVVVACVEQLRSDGLRIPDAAVAEGLAQVQWPARLEVVSRQPLVVLDCAHNVASAQALADTLRESFPSTRRLLVFAVSNDKDFAGMLHILTPLFAKIFLTRYRENPRSVPPEQLADLMRRDSDLPCSVHALPAEAWQAARALAEPHDLICVTGSVFLAGELRPLILHE